MDTIPAEHAEALYGDGEGEAGDTVSSGWTLVLDVEDDTSHVGNSRWHQRYWLVLTAGDGAYYGLGYGIGLTEEQADDLPWEGVPADRELLLTRLYPHAITKVEYRTKPAESLEQQGTTSPAGDDDLPADCPTIADRDGDLYDRTADNQWTRRECGGTFSLVSIAVLYGPVRPATNEEMTA